LVSSTSSVGGSQVAVAGLRSSGAANIRHRQHHRRISGAWLFFRRLRPLQFRHGNLYVLDGGDDWLGLVHLENRRAQVVVADSRSSGAANIRHRQHHRRISGAWLFFRRLRPLQFRRDDLDVLLQPQMSGEVGLGSGLLVRSQVMPSRTWHETSGLPSWVSNLMPLVVMCCQTWSI
jgi:hypothetical protein